MDPLESCYAMKADLCYFIRYNILILLFAFSVLLIHTL